MANPKTPLGPYVAERRKTLNLTQGQLGDVLGYTTQAISKFESGDSQISILVLPDLANLLQLSLDDLIAQNPSPAPYKDPAPKADPEALKHNLSALRLSHGLSQNEQAEILDVSPRSIQNYEAGETMLSYGALLHLLDHYGLKASSFFYQTYSAIPPSNKPKHLTAWIAGAVCLVAAVVVGATSPVWGKGLFGQGGNAASSSRSDSSLSSDNASQSPADSSSSTSKGTSSSNEASSASQGTSSSSESSSSQGTSSSSSSSSES